MCIRGASSFIFNPHLSAFIRGYEFFTKTAASVTREFVFSTQSCPAYSRVFACIPGQMFSVLRPRHCWRSRRYIRGYPRRRTLHVPALRLFEADIVILQRLAGGPFEGRPSLHISSARRHFRGACLRNVALVLQDQEVGGKAVGELLILDLQRLL